MRRNYSFLSEGTRGHDSQAVQPVPPVFQPIVLIFIDMNILWTDAECHGIPRKFVEGCLKAVIQFHLEVFKPKCWVPAVTCDVCFYEVHGWRADETADELVFGFVIERRWIGNLLDFPSLSTTIWSPIVIASTWSCVT